MGQYVGRVSPRLGGSLHFGKPLVPRRSFGPPPPSGDQLKGTTPVHILAKNGCKCPGRGGGQDSILAM